MLTQKNIVRINVFLAICTVIGGLCYDTVSHNLITKSCSSFGFFLLGLINLIYGFREQFAYRSFSVIMVIGLFTGMVADVILEINFMLGALVFALGHIFFIIAYSRILPFRIRDYIPGLFLFALVASLVLFLPIFDFGGNIMQIVCVVYAGIIGIMCGKALSNYHRLTGSLTRALVIGSFLFLLSDVALLFSNFAQVPDIIGSVCVNSYYPAQVILAHALLHTKNG